MKDLIKIFLLVAGFILLTCATQGFPPGGPEDKTPPRVLYAFPPQDTTNVPLDLQVVVEFSEAVIPSSCLDALFITPFPGENVTYKWRRDKRLTIIFGEPLLKDRTYIVTIGAGAKDRRNNMMQQSYTLAFSTGDSLDQGRIQGLVYGDNVEGAQIWAYDLKEDDAPNPAKDFPLYVTQTGKDGKWAFTNMAISRYRLFAVMDRDVNTVYNAEYDLLGVASRDIILDSLDNGAGMMNFRIALEDTTPPMLAAARAPDERHVDIRFTEALVPDSLNTPSNYSITNESQSLSVIDAAVDFTNAAVVHLTTAKQDSGAHYTVHAKHALDLSYLPLLADSSTALFSGSAVPDTLRPKYLAMQPRDSSNFVFLDKSLDFYFTKAMSPESFKKHLVVADTLGDTIPGSLSWPEKSHLIFSPLKNYAKETLYTVTLPVDSIFDFSGNVLADTLFRRQFTTINPDTLSAISGVVSDADSAAEGAFYLHAQSDAKKDRMSYELRLKDEGRYEFKDMMPGRYTIELFRDADGNGRFSPGHAFPYQPAERFYVFPDTIEIRSRWPSDGENILVPK